MNINVYIHTHSHVYFLVNIPHMVNGASIQCLESKYECIYVVLHIHIYIYIYKYECIFTHTHLHVKFPLNIPHMVNGASK